MSMTRNAVTGVAGSLALHACASGQSASNSTSNQTETAQPTSVTSGSTLWIGCSSLYIALEKGFFKAGGLNHLFSTQFVEENPTAAKAFVQGTFQGIDFIKTNPDEAYAIAGERLELKPEEVAADLKGVRLIDLPINIKMTSEAQSDVYLGKHRTELAQFLQDQKQIQTQPDSVKLLDPRFLQEIQASA